MNSVEECSRQRFGDREDFSDCFVAGELQLEIVCGGERVGRFPVQGQMFLVHAVGRGGAGGEGQAAALDVVEIDLFGGHGQGAGEAEDKDNEGGWKHGGLKWGISSRTVVDYY